MGEVNLFYPNTGNYVCIQEEKPLSRYQLKMLECNEIPGMLSVHSTRINGVCTLNYDISKTQRLSSVLGKEIQGKQAKKLLLDILRALLSAEDYLLSFTRCVLNPDYIYVKPNHEVGMVYVPYENQEITSLEDVRLFYHKLLVDYLNHDPNNYNLLIYVSTQGFSLDGLLEKLEDGMDVIPAQSTPGYDSKPVEPVPECPPHKPPKSLIPPKKEKEEPKNLPKQEEDKPDVPFQIPPSIKPDGKPNNKLGDKTKKPAKEPGTSIIEKIIGGGKKKDKAKEKDEYVPVPTDLPKGREYTPVTPQNNNANTSGGSWSGTEMLQDEQSGPNTVILQEQNDPVLIHRGQSFELNSFPFKIGNRGDMNYVIQSVHISKHHATIHRSDGRYYIKDENSSNHTYLNGRQIPPYTEMELNDGDIIKLANEELQFRA